MSLNIILKLNNLYNIEYKNKIPFKNKILKGKNICIYIYIVYHSKTHLYMYIHRIDCILSKFSNLFFIFDLK